jgi:hypothetical protein
MMMDNFSAIITRALLGGLTLVLYGCTSNLGTLPAALADDHQAAMILGRMFNNGTWQPEAVFSVGGAAPVAYTGTVDSTTSGAINNDAQGAVRTCTVNGTSVAVTFTSTFVASYLSELTPTTVQWSWVPNTPCCQGSKANSNACPGSVVVGFYKTQWTSDVTTTTTINGTVTCDRSPGVTLTNMGNNEVKATSTGWNIVQLQDLDVTCRQPH